MAPPAESCQWSSVLPLLNVFVEGVRPATAVPVCVKAAQCRPLHLTHGPALCSTKKGQQTTDTPKDGKNTKEDEEMYDGPEYIPRRKAKNPMMNIGYAWWDLPWPYFQGVTLSYRSSVLFVVCICRQNMI